MEPTFVIAGGQRCGTTTLYALCDEHPEIYMAKPAWPEPKFFLNEATAEQGRQWYLDRWFANSEPVLAVGEKSTSYLETPGTASRMKQMFPELRVVFILRHPVERAISNYRFSCRNRLETLTLEEAIENEDARLRDQSFSELSAHPFAYQRRGRYFEHLEQYFEVFPPQHLKLLLNDDLNNQGEQLCEDLFTFLGVDPRFIPQSLRLKHNEGTNDNLRVSQALMDQMLASFAADNLRLGKYLDRDLSAWSSITPALRELIAA